MRILQDPLRKSKTLIVLIKKINNVNILIFLTMIALILACLDMKYIFILI